MRMRMKMLGYGYEDVIADGRGILCEGLWGIYVFVLVENCGSTRGVESVIASAP